MTRNLDDRVEVMTPVEEPALRARLEEILEVNLRDDFAWELGPHGDWHRGEGSGGRSAQREFQRLTRKRCPSE